MGFARLCGLRFLIKHIIMPINKHDILPNNNHFQQYRKETERMKSSMLQVLLIGNGINQAYGGISWPELLSKIRVRSDYHTEALKSPMPLQAILLTNNNIKDALRNNKEAFYGEIRSPEQEQVLISLLDMDADDILTTNYSYELEIMAVEPGEDDENLPILPY